MNRILITGGTGFIGSSLANDLIAKGHEVVILSRKKIQTKHPRLNYCHWDIKRKLMDVKALMNTDFIVNLVGANVGSKKWTRERKQEILDSRMEPTNLLFDNVSRYSPTIKAVISSSAVGYYGTFVSDKILTEETPNGSDFMAEVCRQWEEEAFRFEKLGCRVVVMRKGAVLGRKGELYRQMSAFAKWGINTAVGNGKQYLPWIYIKDLLRLYSFVLDTPIPSGAYNSVCSAHTDMNEFASALSKALRKPILTPNAPAFVIKLLYGELSQMLLCGNKVGNSKLRDLGFKFEHNDIDEVLHEIANEKPTDDQTLLEKFSN